MRSRLCVTPNQTHEMERYLVKTEPTPPSQLDVIEQIAAIAAKRAGLVKIQDDERHVVYVKQEKTEGERSSPDFIRMAAERCTAALQKQKPVKRRRTQPIDLTDAFADECLPDDVLASMPLP